MATSLALPIARLRAAGCRVSTIIGHSPKIGDFRYSVRLPDGVPAYRMPSVGNATIDRPRYSDGHHLIVKAGGVSCAPHRLINDYRLSVANALTEVAEHVESFDRSSRDDCTSVGFSGEGRCCEPAVVSRATESGQARVCFDHDLAPEFGAARS